MKAPQEIPDFELVGPPIMPAEQAAKLAAAEGAEVRWFRGNYWQCRPTRRFWYPVARIQQLPPDRIGSPALASSGFRAYVTQPEAATGVAVTSVVDDLPSYSATRVTKDQRRMVRRALHLNEYRVISEPGTLLSQCWDVAVDAAARTGQPILEGGREAFLARYRRRLLTGHYWMLAGLYDGRVRAFLTARPVDDTLYVDEIAIADAGRAPGTGVGLYWLTMRANSKTPGLRRAWLGGWYPHHPQIAHFKESFGVRWVPLPVISRVAPPLRLVVRRRNPIMYANLGLRSSFTQEELRPQYPTPAPI